MVATGVNEGTGRYAWNESNVNSLSHQHFYLEAGVYTNTAVQLRAQGTAEARRTLSLYNGNDTHPAALPDNEQASVHIYFNKDGGSVPAAYWILDRISNLDRDLNPTLWFVKVGDGSSGTGCHHNIINRWHGRDMRGIKIDPGSDYNTVQNCYINGATQIGREEDAVGVSIANSRVTDARTVGTKVINNDIRNMGDGIQAVESDEAGAYNPKYPNTIIDSNRIWMDKYAYMDGSGNPDVDGEYMVAENAIDFKAGGLPGQELIITNNIMWGYREQDPTIDTNISAPSAIVVSFPATDLYIENNIIFDNLRGVNMINLCGANAKFNNNIIYDTGAVNPTGGDSMALTSTGGLNCGEDGTEFKNNTIIENYAGDAFGVYDSNAGSVIENNLFISTDDVNTNAANQTETIGNSWYYDHTNKRLGGSENVDNLTNPASTANMGDYTFEYEIFTASPKSKTLYGIISTDTSPHYGVAGSTITQ